MSKFGVGAPSFGKFGAKLQTFNPNMSSPRGFVWQFTYRAIESLSANRCVVCAGKSPTDQYLEAMMNEAPGPINFTMFLTMFGEKLNGTDPEDVIKNAFACFDDENKGMVENF